jgi:hypothetical protein
MGSILRTEKLKRSLKHLHWYAPGSYEDIVILMNASRRRLTRLGSNTCKSYEQYTSATHPASSR